MGQLVAHGDTTSTRGVVIAVASSMFEEGRRLALHGEEATCGNCKGSFKIVGTVTYMSDDGRMLVQHGDSVMCPCGKNRVLANSNMHYQEEGSEASALASRAASAAPAQASESMAVSYDEQFQLLTEGGSPIPNANYKIVSSSGMLKSGVTDADGKTMRVFSTDKEDLHVHWMKSNG